MRVVTWNMQYNFNAARHDEAWSYLLNEFAPDIALLQEAAIPESVRRSHSCVFTPPTGRAWGSAVIALGREATPVQIPAESVLARFGSRIAAASVADGDRSMLVASVHPSTRKADEAIREGVDPATLAIEGFWEADVFLDGLSEITASHEAFLVGGDWMVTWLWDKIRRNYSDWHGGFFERASAKGWVETTSKYFGASEIDLRTWYGKRNGMSTPYQFDRIFADKASASRITGCDAIAHPAQRLGLSDHAPLVLELGSPNL